jgi:hypothetical protein
MFLAQNVMSMSYVYNKYLQWRVGYDLVNAAKTCRPTTKCNLQHIVGEKYQIPAYIRFANSISPRESPKSYAMHASTQLIDSLDTAFYRRNRNTTVLELFTVPLLQELKEKITDSSLQQLLGETYTRASADKARMGLTNFFENKVSKLDIPTNLEIGDLRELVTSHTTGVGANAKSVILMQENKDNAVKLMQRCITALEKKFTDKTKPDKAQEMAQTIWTEVTQSYVDIFRAQQEFINKLNPLSALERWHRNRTVERLEYLQDTQRQIDQIEASGSSL